MMLYNNRKPKNSSKLTPTQSEMGGEAVLIDVIVKKSSFNDDIYDRKVYNLTSKLCY